FVLEKAATDIGLVLGLPTVAAATAPAALPNITDLAKLTADLVIEPKSCPDVSLTRNARLASLAAAIVPRHRDPAKEHGFGRLGAAVPLPKNMDLGRLVADLGINVASPSRTSAESDELQQFLSLPWAPQRSRFRQVFDGMGPRQNEFLAYADYLVGLNDLIQKVY
ncbi:hypothetical protein HK405_002520, partial [Cladochytrium tenue]